MNTDKVECLASKVLFGTISGRMWRRPLVRRQRLSFDKDLLMSSQGTARLAGFLFVMTFVTSIPALLLYNDVLNETHFIVNTGSDTKVLFGALLEMLLIVANLGTALVLFPIIKRQNEPLALGYIAARTIESVFIAIGIVSVLSIVTLKQDAHGHIASLVPIGKTLVAMHDWTFLLGPGFIVGIGNGLILGYLMYRSGLVPRGLAILGLVGGTLIIASGIAVLLGAFDKGSAPQAIATIPEFIWELSLGFYLMIKGFRPSPILSQGSTPPGSPMLATV
jgi:Domain of unknown function (DUF4386)